MIALQIMGMNYRQIAAKTGYSYSWVKHLFARDGKVREMIHDLSHKERKDLPDEHNWMAGYTPPPTEQEWVDSCTQESEAVRAFNDQLNNLIDFGRDILYEPTNQN